MNQQEASEYLNKYARLILRNNFHFSGNIIDVTEDTLVMMDIKNERVTINLKDIMFISGGGENGR